MTVTAYKINVKDNKVQICCSNGKKLMSSNAFELLKFLRYSSGQSVRVFWDLDSISPILRLFPEDILERLSKFDEFLTYGENELYYLPGRLFRVGKTRFYGIRDFWGSLSDGDPTLEDLQKKGDELVKTLDSIGLSNPRKLTSPIAVFEDSEWGKSLYTSLPKGLDIPESAQEMLEYANQADAKDWVSNYVVGHFDIVDYDQSSSYPGIASCLPDLRELAYWKSKTYGEKEEKATLGIVKGKMFIDPKHEYAHTSPIISRNEIAGNYLGNLPEDCYTLAEVRYITKSGIGKFTMKDGWFAYGENYKRPLQEIMLTLYKKRSLSLLAGSICKSIANSLIGKMIETKVSGEFGVLRNDLYHALITAGARAEIARFLSANQVKKDELICVQTDGVKLTRNIPLACTSMGKWVNKGAHKALVLSPFKVYSADAKPYRLTYKDILEMISEHPLGQVYDKNIKHRVTLVQSLRQYKDMGKVGELIDMPDSVNLPSLKIEQNRIFKNLPLTGRDLLSGKYKSEPIVL